MRNLHDFDAELHRWHIVMDPLSPTLVGFVKNDKKGRFANGRFIRTSALLTPIRQIQTGAIVQSLNSRYLLVGPAAVKN